MSYSPPDSAKPFTLSISDQDLSEWRQLLQLSKLGPITYENQQSEENFGVTYEWLSEAKDYWLNKYNWREQEKYINSFDNFQMQIDNNINLHFIGHFAERKDAIPIVFMHGWPGSFVEFLPMLGLIRDKWSKKDLPYHIIVPSLPGYTLSAGTQPTDKNWTMEDNAGPIHKLMTNLGFEKYIAQGGDVGSFVARALASKDACVGIHLNMMPAAEQPDPSTLSTREKQNVERAAKWYETGRAYMLEHGSRPSTIGHVVSSSPLALLAWVGEKLLEWTDTNPTLDAILTNVSLYWFTETFPRSIYAYRQDLGPTRPYSGYISKPSGFSSFPYELMPGTRSALEKNYNLVYYKEHERGGHFAAWEHPELLWEDVQEFVRKVWEV